MKTLLLVLCVVCLAGCTSGDDPLDPTSAQMSRETKGCNPDTDTITVAHMWVCIGPITVHH